jgi:hypothetical protein
MVSVLLLVSAVSVPVLIGAVLLLTLVPHQVEVVPVVVVPVLLVVPVAVLVAVLDK